MITLNGEWKFRRCDKDDYFTGTVPGSVYSDLLANNLMPDPYFRENEDEVTALSDYDYEYSKSFFADKSLLKNDELILTFEGIDTISEIYMNGKKIGSTDNFHTAFEFNIINNLVLGENILKVILFSPTKYIHKEHNKRPLWCNEATMPGFNHIRKPHYMFGWDWGPKLPDLGIWKNVYIKTINKAVVEDFYVRQNHFNKKVELNIKPEYRMISVNSAEIECVIISPDGEIVFSQSTPIISDSIFFEAIIENPQLWWPNGLGEQNLYTVSIRIKSRNKVISGLEKKIGLRTLTINKNFDKWGQSFCFEVNGISIFANGGNYIPEDNILGLCCEDRTKTLLESCKKANFNCVRIWGGGHYATDYFMELCDKLGLIVWHDFMFACAVYELTDSFKNNITKEAVYNIKRLRNHASLGMWCGNNEMEVAWLEWGLPQNEKLKQDYFEQFERLFPELVKKYSPDTFYWPASPSSQGGFIDPDSEREGDAHYWGVWHGKKWFEDFENHYFRFASEYGFQSLPSMKTIKEFATKEDMNIYSPVMEKHQKCIDFLGNNGNMIISNYIANYYRYPKGFESFVYASQIVQGDCLITAIEHFRRNRGRCMGSTYWQINDSNPVISWSTIDYFGRWKASHYYVKRSYAPVLISAIMKDNNIQIYLVNDRNLEFNGRIEYSIIHQENGVILENKEYCRISELKSKVIDNIDVSEYTTDKIDCRNMYFEYRLYENNELISNNTMLFVKPKHFNFIKPEISYELYKDDTSVFIKINSNVFASKVGIEFKTFDIILEDNYFDLLPNTERVIKLETDEDIAILEKEVILTSVYDIAK